MAEGVTSPRLSFKARTKLWEQRALHGDCVIIRNRHQLLLDEKLAMELQKKFDEEVARQVNRNPEVPQSTPQGQRINIDEVTHRPPQAPRNRGEALEVRGRPLTRSRINEAILGSPRSPPALDYERLHEIAERLGPAKPLGMRPRDIKQLPERRLRPQDIPKISSATQTCHICLNDWKSGDYIKSLPCFHDFHKKCISEWLKLKKSCPVCRMEVKLQGH